MKNNGSRRGIRFFGLWLVYILTFTVLAFLFRGNIDLGTKDVPAQLGLVFWALCIAGVPHIVPKILERSKQKLESENFLYSLVFVIDTVIFSIIKSFPALTGFGISNYLLVLFLGIVSTLIYIFFKKFSIYLF